MSRRYVFLKTAVAGLAIVATAGSLSAQDRADAKVEVRKISNILKTKVVIQDDKPAGEIVDVVYSEGGCIDYYVASYDNRQYVVPFDVVQYRPADRVVFVDIAPNQFEHVHFFSGNQWPDLYAPGFRDQVFASFNIRAGGRNRTTFRQGADVDVDVRNRDRDRDVNRDREPANRDRENADRDRADRNRDQEADRNRSTTGDRNRDADRPNAGSREGDRPNSSADRPERTPSTNPGTTEERPRTEPRDETPAPPRAGSGTNPGRDGATPPRAGSDTNPGRGSTPPRPGVTPGSGAGTNPPANSSGNSPRPGSGSDNKPLSPPPVVPK